MRATNLFKLFILLPLLLPAAWGLSPKIPQPPDDWKANLTPGFEPAIETVLVGEDRQNVPVYEDLPGLWGNAAVPVLLKLYTDPAWGDYQGKLVRILEQFGDAECLTQVRTEAEGMCQRIVAGERQRRDVASDLQEEKHRLAGLLPLLRWSGDAALEDIAVSLVAQAPREYRMDLMWEYGRHPEGLHPDLEAFRAVRRTTAGLGELIDNLEELERGQEDMTPVLEAEANTAAAPAVTGAELLHVWWEKDRGVFSPSTRRELEPRRWGPDPRLEALVAGLTSRQRSQIEAVIVQALGGSAIGASEGARLAFYAGAARHLGLVKALDGVQDFLVHMEGDWEPGYIDDVVDCLVEARGDRLTPFFHRLGKNQDASPLARMMAMVALGKIGGTRSVEAFRELRDAARALPGAQQAWPGYTHGQRVWETFDLVHRGYWLSRSDSEGLRNHPRDRRPSWGGIRVSRDFCRATMGMGRGFFFQRHGEEWLLVEIPLTLILY